MAPTLHLVNCQETLRTKALLLLTTLLAVPPAPAEPTNAAEAAAEKKAADQQLNEQYAAWGSSFPRQLPACWLDSLAQESECK